MNHSGIQGRRIAEAYTSLIIDAKSSVYHIKIPIQKDEQKTQWLI